MTALDSSNSVEVLPLKPSDFILLVLLLLALFYALPRTFLKWFRPGRP